jgi:hypothetical protein
LHAYVGLYHERRRESLKERVDLGIAGSEDKIYIRDPCSILSKKVIHQGFALDEEVFMTDVLVREYAV